MQWRKAEQIPEQKQIHCLQYAHGIIYGMTMYQSPQNCSGACGLTGSKHVNQSLRLTVGEQNEAALIEWVTEPKFRAFQF